MCSIEASELASPIPVMPRPPFRPGPSVRPNPPPVSALPRQDHARQCVVRMEQAHYSRSSPLWILIFRTNNRRVGAPETCGLEPQALSRASFARRIFMRRQPANSVPPRAGWGRTSLFR
jgi:hypothetical protein